VPPTRTLGPRSRARAPRVGACLALLCACSGPSYEEFDRLARTTAARTIVYERDFSLYSPFDLDQTRSWLELVEQELTEVAALLEADPAEQREREGPLIVLLQAIEGLGVQVSVVEQDRIRISLPEQHPLHGIEGHANQRRATVLVQPTSEVVFPDGRTLRGTTAASAYRSTLRHELAHVVADSAGLAGGAWLDEGIATLVEHVHASPEKGALEVEPERLRYSRQVARQGPALADLLRTVEDGAAIAAGRTPADRSWRPRLLAFFSFLLEREVARGGDLRSALDGARRAGRRELERLEPEWRTWLEPGPLDEPNKAAKGSPAETSRAHGQPRPALRISTRSC
jgi:hypothetical protein